MIRTRCPKCEKLLGLDDSAAGKTGRCPLCKATFPVPAEEPPVVELAPASVEEVPDAEWVEEPAKRREETPDRRPMRRRRKRLRIRRPMYLEDEEDDTFDFLSGMFTGRKLVGVVLIVWGILNGFGGIVLGMNSSPLLYGALGCGALMLLAGVYLFLSD
jgi:hypothetical protein